MSEPFRIGEKHAIGMIHHIISAHHAFLRNTAPTLKRIVGELPEVPEATRCGISIDLLLKDIDQHLMKEERILFPTIEEIELCVIEGTEPQIMACGVMGPVNQAVYEHNQIREILNAIVRDCPHTGREDLNEAVVALREHVLDHIHIEEDELFPLAEELCPGITV